MKIIIKNILAALIGKSSLGKPNDVMVDHHEVDYLIIINDGKTQLEGKINTNMENKTFDDLKIEIKNNIEKDILGYE